MKKKLHSNKYSKFLLLDKTLLELAGIEDWVEIIMDQDLIIIRKTDAPAMNGKHEVVG